jgi:hypothetical protein
MSSIQISRAARVATYDRLESAFNDNLSAASSDFGVDPFTIDFADTADEAGSFFETFLAREELFQLLKPQHTCMTLYSAELEDQNWQHPNTFSGAVMVAGEVHRWIQPSQAVDGEDYLDAIKSALIQTLNGEDFNGSGLYYNHAIHIENTPWSFFLDGMIATVHFELTFEVTA